MHRTARAYARKRFAEDVFGGVAVCPLPYVKTVIDDLFKIFRVRSVLESGPETDERRDSGVAVFVAERLHVKTESAGDVTVNIVLRNDAVGVRERQCAAPVGVVRMHRDSEDRGDNQQHSGNWQADTQQTTPMPMPIKAMTLEAQSLTRS